MARGRRYLRPRVRSIGRGAFAAVMAGMAHCHLCRRCHCIDLQAPRGTHHTLLILSVCGSCRWSMQCISDLWPSTLAR